MAGYWPCLTFRATLILLTLGLGVRQLAAQPVSPAEQPASPDACSAINPDPIEVKSNAPDRLALLITNQDYKAVGPLTKAHNDGAILCRALVSLGFSVHHVKDANLEKFYRELREFLIRISHVEKGNPNGASFFYFSGHGAVADAGGSNYLIPTGEAIARREELVYSGINLDKLIEQIQTTAQTYGMRNNFVVIDACRNPAFPAGTRGTRGLTPVVEQSGLMIAFSTAPGLTAADENYYSTALADELQMPNRDAYLAFRAVRRRVLAATNNQQFPWMHDGLIDAFYFKVDASAPTVRESLSLPVGDKTNVVNGRLVIRDCDLCPKMVVLVPPLSPPGKGGSQLTSFAMGTHEVTFEEWESCVNDGGCRQYMPNDAGFGREKHPVINVSFTDANLYLDWLSKKSDKHYRLPTEAEWEYAARADGDTTYISGNDPTQLCKSANGDGARLFGAMPCSGGRNRGTEEVGHYKPNAFGLYDMTGNVWEWVNGCYAGGLPKSASDPCDRVLRGGSWSSGIEELKISSRKRAPVAYFGRTVGFRVARSNP